MRFQSCPPFEWGHVFIMVDDIVTSPSIVSAKKLQILFDNYFFEKNALVILISYSAVDTASHQCQT